MDIKSWLIHIMRIKFITHNLYFRIHSKLFNCLC